MGAGQCARDQVKWWGIEGCMTCMTVCDRWESLRDQVEYWATHVSNIWEWWRPTKLRQDSGIAHDPWPWLLELLLCLLPLLSSSSPVSLLVSLLPLRFLFPPCTTWLLIVHHFRHTRQENSFLNSSDHCLHELVFALYFTAFYLFIFLTIHSPMLNIRGVYYPWGRLNTYMLDFFERIKLIY